MNLEGQIDLHVPGTTQHVKYHFYCALMHPAQNEVHGGPCMFVHDMNPTMLHVAERRGLEGLEPLAVQ